jgi:hypothetical protein
VSHRRLVAVVTVLVLGGNALATPAGRERRLRGSEALAEIYDTILDARFEQVEEGLRHACPPAPAEACQLLRVTADWWRIQLDPFDRSRDLAFREAVDKAIDAAHGWTARAPADPEAWFYLGGAYALRIQFQVLREEKLAAARDGKRIKQALERAVSIDPRMQDAYFGIGMYQYYAAVAPTAARVLRWLMFLPGGNRTEGLEQMQRAGRAGLLLRSEAEFQLHLVYLWYEDRAADAAALLAGLRDRHPTNPLFPLLLGDVHDVYFHDPTAALDTYQQVLDAAQDDRVMFPELAEARARLGIARQLDRLAETDRAIEQLKAVREKEPEAPYSAHALAALRLGLAYDRIGQRDLAGAHYRAAAAHAPPDDPLAIAPRTRQALRRRPDVRAGEAYRLALEGWRALQRGEMPAAETLLTRSLRLRREDPVTHYRYGRLRLARGDEAGALTAFDQTLRLRASCPPAILARAYLDAGGVHERAGRRDRAAAMYRSASGVFGAAIETRTGAQHALARLGQSS